MDVYMGDQNETETQRKNRLRMFRSILNYFKGRSLSLNFVLACKQPSINIPPDMRTLENLYKDMQSLQEDITLIQAIKKSLNLLTSSLTCLEITNVDDHSLKRESLNKIEGIIYFSKAIMKLYNECGAEVDLLEKMKNYSEIMVEYMKSLENIEQIEKNESNKNTQEQGKIALHIYKINLMRKMKATLIGYVSLNCPDLLGNILNFRSPLRRQLTIDDFRDTWDVGLSS